MKRWQKPRPFDYVAGVLALAPWLTYGLYVNPSANSMAGCSGMVFFFRWLWGLGAVATTIALVEVVRLARDKAVLNHVPGIVLGIGFVAMAWLMMR